MCASCERTGKACKAERAPRARRSTNSEASIPSATSKPPRKAAPLHALTPLDTGNDGSVSESTSSTTTMGQNTKTPRTSPATRKTEPPQQRRLLSHPHPPHRHTMQAPQHTNSSSQDSSSVRGRQIEKGSTFLIPLVCLLPALVAWNTDPDTYVAAKQIVINIQVAAEIRDNTPVC